jgi:uncharacterized protein YceK
MRITAVSLVVLLGAVAAGCGSVDSAYPLSEGLATKVDPDLVGYWVATKEGESNPTDLPFIFVVGRGQAGADAMQLGLVGLDRDQHVRAVRTPLLPTTIGGRRYLSVQNPDETHAYGICGYEYDEASKDDLWLYVPDVACFAKGVLAGDLEGRVEGASGDLALRQVHLTGDTASLRAWIETHAKDAFRRVGAPLHRLRTTFRFGGATASEAKPAVPSASVADPATTSMDDLSLANASTRDVLESVAQRLGRTLRVTDAASAKLKTMRVTLYLEDATVAGVLDTLLLPYDLAWRVAGDALVVGTSSEIPRKAE